MRSPEKASRLKGVKLIAGDARDEKVLREARKDQDAVVSALGTPASPFREERFSRPRRARSSAR